MRLALGIEYRGTAYCGWQKQHHVIGVQQRLEEALSKVANCPVEVVCAGRTDTGVHAQSQIVHFDTQAVRDARAWKLGTNANLPSDIAVILVKEVSEEFHARFSAHWRRYRYIFCNRQSRPGLLSGHVSWAAAKMDHQLMHDAAQALLGEHDFTSFRSSICQSHTATRNMQNISVTRDGDFVYLDIQANAFLHHMVRNIAGSLLCVGRGEKPVAWMADLLAMKDRTQAGITAPAAGLYFCEAAYPEAFSLPESPPTITFS